MPWRLIGVILFASRPVVIDIAGNVATRAETDQMRIISRRTDRNCLGCSSVNIAKMMCDSFKRICIKLFVLLNFVQNDRVMRWFCLIRSSAIQKDAQRYCGILLTVPLKGSCATRKKSHPWVIVIPRSTTVPAWTLQLRFWLASFLSVGYKRL